MVYVNKRKGVSTELHGKAFIGVNPYFLGGTLRNFAPREMKWLRLFKNAPLNSTIADYM